MDYSNNFKCLYIVDYICLSRFSTNIYSMLVLFTYCWGINLSIQARVGKLNGDLLQPSEIRYEVWSFSVRYLISLAYWKGLISGFKLSVVVPQAIGISLCNNAQRRTCSVCCWNQSFAPCPSCSHWAIVSCCSTMSYPSHKLWASCTSWHRTSMAMRPGGVRLAPLSCPLSEEWPLGLAPVWS